MPETEPAIDIPAIDIRALDDLTALGPPWRDLESRADGSFFQSWAWTGCLAEERFPAPWLLTARRGGRPIALGLFNRRPRIWLRPATLLLGETGGPGPDSIFIEHNDLLVDRAEAPGLAAMCWTKLAAGEAGRARWILSGAPRTACDALTPLRRMRIVARRPAPLVDFEQMPKGATILDGLSANARQQLRRSLRAWERIGTLQLEIAASPVEAQSWLDGLKALHQRYWNSRGKPGAFAEPFFERFHRALIGRAGSGQSVDVIRVSAGSRLLGYLYNLVHHGWVATYQSGIDYGPDAERLRPGLICHLLAIEHYRLAGMRLYDFLGGEARYKRGFANAERELLWLEARPRRSLF